MHTRFDPLLIHRYWEGEPYPLDGYTTKLLKNLNPHLEIHDWTPKDLPEEVVSHLHGIEDQVVDRDVIRHRANIIRLALLHTLGGWWYDHDVVPLLPVEALPFPVVAAHGSRMCNSFMGYPAAHPELKLALNRIAGLATGSLTSPKASGEEFLDSILTAPRITYPFDAAGRRISFDQRHFAVHLYGTSHSAS